MKNKIFTLFIALFAILGTGVAETPFTFSTNTDAGAVWYRIKNARAVTEGRGSYLTAQVVAGTSDAAVLQAAGAAGTSGTDAQLWCFIGAETGFQIYNKAFLTNNAKLISKSLNNSVYAVSSDAWTSYFTLLTDDQGNYGLLSSDVASAGAADANQSAMHGLQNGYIYTYNFGDFGSKWVFESATTLIPIEKTALQALVTTITTKVIGNENDNTFASKYQKAIDKINGYLTTAQGVLDNSASTQADIDAQIPILQTENYFYDKTTVDLPFVPSSSPTATDVNWYFINNYGNSTDGFGNPSYLTVAAAGDNDYQSALRQKVKDGSDAQLWCFVGDNVDGFLIYSKADVTKNLGYTLQFGTDVTTNKWLIENKSGKYSIINPNGVIETQWDQSEGAIHAGGGGTNGNVIIYNDNVNNSKWLFEAKSSGTISGVLKTSLENLIVYSGEGYVLVKGAEGLITVTTLTGISYKQIQAKENTVIPLSKGLYIVSVGGKSVKAIVQ